MPEQFDCKIIIEGADARFEGTFPTKVVQDATSYFQPGYQYTQRYKAHVWDGRIKLFRRTSRTMPAGLVHDVVEALKAHEVPVKVEVDDSRHCPKRIYSPAKACAPITDLHDMQLDGVGFDYPFDYQPECALAMVRGQRGIAAVATNGGKTIIAALVTKLLRFKTLFLVPNLELLYQTQRVFEKRLGVPVGVIGDQKWDVKNKWVTIATVDTLYSRLAKPECRSVLETTDVLFADECHHVGSDSWYQVMRACPAYYRFGLSGTPLKRTDGADLRLIGVTGPVLYEVRNKTLIERGVSVQPIIYFIPIEKPKISKGVNYREAYEVGIVENPYRNNALCAEVAKYVEQGLSVLILVREIKHGDILDKKLWSYPKGSFVPHQFINGKESSEVRQKALAEFSSGTIKALIATSILDEGVDVPNIDVLVLAGGGKSSIRTLQRVGRGLRTGGNIDKLFVVDTADFQNKYLLKHSLQRMEDYKAEECFEIREVK